MVEATHIEDILMTPYLLRSVAVVLAASCLAAAPASAQNTCDSGKLKCLRKKVQCLLKVHEKAIKKGEAPDNERLTLCRTKFDAPTTGCIAKVEAKQDPMKPETICTVSGETGALEAIADDCAAAPLAFADVDDDGYGDPLAIVVAATPPSGYVAVGGDCDDANADAYPSALELCDAADNDCDGVVDDSCGSIYFRDADNDGYGDPNVTVTAPSQPSGYVAIDGDCNDGDVLAYPNAPEFCDALDNDCDAVVDEAACPAGCSPTIHAGHSYMFCSTVVDWPTASFACAANSQRLARIDDATENAYVQSTGGSGIPIFLGGSDAATEGEWRWTDGAQFWQGSDPASGGVSVGGLYSNWGAGEPNAFAAENCLRTTGTGTWNDVTCTTTSPFACERY